MISCYLQRLVGQMRLKPNEEWLRLKDVIERGGDAGLEVWLKEVACLASDLESNFELASKGKKTKHCVRASRAETTKRATSRRIRKLPRKRRCGSVYVNTHTSLCSHVHVSTHVCT